MNFYFLFHINNFFVITYIIRTIYRNIKGNILTLFSNTFICCNYFCTKDTCVICLDTINKNNYAKLICNHKFCTSCLVEWTRINNTCPICRYTIVENLNENSNNIDERNLTINIRLRRRNAVLLENDSDYQYFIQNYVNEPEINQENNEETIEENIEENNEENESEEQYTYELPN